MKQSVITPKWYTTAQVAEMLGYGLTKTKYLVVTGQIRSVKDGGRRRILPEVRQGQDLRSHPASLVQAQR